MQNQDAQDARAQEARSETQAPPPGNMPPVEVEPHEVVLAEQLALARTSLAELEEATRRAEAEIDTIRRRVLEDISRAHKYAIEGFAEAVLPVKDSLETALRIDTPSVASLQEGVAITLKQLDSAFARNALVVIDPPPGARVDPALHKAISMVPAPQSANTIVTVLQKGYMIGDRLLRPALVTVAQEKGAEPEPDAGPERGPDAATGADT